jgi:hypothetical protein
MKTPSRLATSPNPAPCFLIGAPRSGTTWIQRLLQTHPDICGGEESGFFQFFAQILREAPAMYNDRKLGPLAYMTEDALVTSLRQVWDDMFNDVYTANPTARVHLEKTPFHALFMTEIVTLFPDARFIVLQRDSRAVASSLLAASRSWGRHWAASTPKAAAAEWYRHVNAPRKWQNAHPDHPILTIRYEDVMKDTPGNLQKMLEFALQDDSVNADQTYAAFKEDAQHPSDPAGFTRKRGSTGWQTDLSLREKLVIWRYTRKLMKDIGYDITPFA